MIHIGSSYYLPHHPESQWREDFARMRQAGHTAVRIGELVASWDLLEQRPREPDFASLDASFELAEQHGLSVLLGTGANCPPAWLLAEHADLRIVDRDGRPYPHGAMWSWACINHPAYLEESDRYLGQLVERYADRGNLLGWQIHNEPGYPFVAREDMPAPPWYDYNEHTIAAFRRWLQDRYATIDDLNDAWLWVPANARYTGFDQIDAPRRTAGEWGAAAAWLDWRRFTCANWNGFVRRQHEQIKKACPATPTMVNMMGEALDRSGRLGVDSWTLAGQCDAIGYDLYPGMREVPADAQARPGHVCHAAWFLDFAAATARAAGRELWLPEMESGPLGGWAAGPLYATRAADIRRWALMGLARGTRMLLYQGYRQWPSLALNWGALVDWHGRPTERYDAVGQIAGMLAGNAELFEQATPQPAQVAVLHSHDSTLFNAATGAQALADQAMFDMHETLWRLGHAVDFVSPAQVGEKLGYRLLILPFQTMVSAQLAAQIAEFVRAGGAIVSMPRTALVDDGCRVWPDRPGGGLDQVLGVQEVAIETVAASGVELQAAGEPAGRGCHHRQQLQVVDGAEPENIAVFADGSPAITANWFGQGLAIHCATHIDMAVERDSEFEKLWSGLLERCKVVPQRLAADSKAQLVECRLLVGADSKRLLFATNHGHEQAQAVFVLDEPPRQIRNLLSPDYGRLTPVDGGVQLDIAAREGAVFALD